MKYFLHDTNSFQDEKITMLFMEHGYEGLGLFYTLLEKIALQEKPIKTDVLKRQLRVGKKLEKCWSFMEEIELISSNNGETFNERILSYSETYQIKKEKTREKVAQWREKQEVIKDVTSYVPVSNPPKVKESKVKESKEREERPQEGLQELKFINQPDARFIKMKLPPLSLQASKETLAGIGQRGVHDSQILSLWESFKIQFFTGDKWYQSEGDIFRHFINTLKSVKFLPGPTRVNSYVSKATEEQNEW